MHHRNSRCGVLLLAAFLLQQGACSWWGSDQPSPDEGTHWYNAPVVRAIWGDYDEVPDFQLNPDPKEQRELLRRGEYLVHGPAACGFCHSAKPSDPDAPLHGGQILDDRFGSVSVPNITPDKETGIGNWSAWEVMRALRASIDREGKPLSVDAHANYRWLSDRDAKAIALYLFSLPPIRHKVERRELGPFERNRFALFPQHREFEGYVPEFSARDRLGYGRYLTHHVAQCYSCHTAADGLLNEPVPFAGSKNKYAALGDRLSELIFSEGPSARELELLSEEGRQAVGEEFDAVAQEESQEGAPRYAPDIRGGSATGLFSWSNAQIVQYLTNGAVPTGGQSDPHLCPWPFYRRLTDEDKSAIADYLKSVP